MNFGFDHACFFRQIDFLSRFFINLSSPDREVETQSSQFESTDKSISKPVFNGKESLLQSNSHVTMLSLRCAESSQYSIANQVVKMKRAAET